MRFWNYVEQKFPATVIRSKGLFWLASRPDQALVWSQAGGSLRADTAGVWWSSMSFEERTRYVAFVNNQREIESGWDATYGDRKNELVFIGQEMDREQMIADLNACLASEPELATGLWKQGYEDDWPVQRAYAMV